MLEQREFEELRGDLETVLGKHEPGAVLGKVDVKRALGGDVELVELRVMAPVAVGEVGFGAVEAVVREVLGDGVSLRVRTELVRGSE